MKCKQQSALLNVVIIDLIIILLIGLTVTTANSLASSSSNADYDGSGSKLKPTGTLEQVSTPVTTQDFKTWSIQYRVSGGLLGMRQQLEINSDTQKLIAVDEKRDKFVTRHASPEQITNLMMLLKNIKLSRASIDSSRLNNRCADCFQYRLTLSINEQKRTIRLNESQLRQNAEYANLINLLSSLLNQMLL